MPQAPERLSPPFMLSRVFNAPRELVWQALTQLEHLGRWMSPAGLEPVPGSIDLRVGGVYHYGMKTPDGNIMWGKWTFREIVAPERLVVVVNFSDAQQGVTRHPMAVNWPLSTLSTTTLTEEGGRTRMSLQWQALDATDEENATFDGAHAGMTQGWGGTMNQLDAYLVQLQAPA
ncbi:MAG: ATPase [Burkholderiales bacterium PBB5]|nr:MAG: ATPase [Burkholderiales bacterium PBB5]